MSDSSSADHDQMNSVINNFLKEYYRVFDENAVGLFDLYQDDAVFSMDGTKFVGKRNIVYMLNGYVFNRCAHSISKFDYHQLNNTSHGVLVTVIGTIRLSDYKTRNFSQTFRLMPNSKGRLSVANSILSMFADDEKM
ncbi:Nuclear transport factor 2 [Macleaya cordata]|uniref:NTF2-related export protein n=1 Tax=Macleaya cordata TaxID=56857 RepID=A0A200QGB8_MACCD|nr:Nuclear transport factor 2 [Macleaya cordata]